MRYKSFRNPSLSCFFALGFVWLLALSGCSDTKVEGHTSIDYPKEFSPKSPDPKKSDAPKGASGTPGARSGGGAAAGAEDTLLPGHSHRGHAFNEGPRERAELLEGMPRVSFATTLPDERSQQFFNQGIGQLHGFWNFEAERSFREVVLAHPEHPMGYWGVAMANTVFGAGDASRARAALTKAKELNQKKAASARENFWIEALDALYFPENLDEKVRVKEHLALLKKLVSTYPQDLEAKVFYVLQSWHLDSNHSKDELNELIGDVLAVAPLHPIHHYKIHLWQTSSGRALESARQSGFSGPGIAHLWHMPAHTYEALQRPREALWHLEASARVDHKHMADAKIMPYQIHNYFHNNAWLAKQYAKTGMPDRAVSLATNLVQVARHPKLNRTDSLSEAYQVFAETLVDYEMWDEAIELSEGPHPFYSASNDWNRDLTRLVVIAIARASKQGGHFELAKRQLEEFRASLPKMLPAAELKAAMKLVEEKIRGVTDYAMLKLHSELLNQEKIEELLKSLAESIGTGNDFAALVALELGQTKLAERMVRDAIDHDPQNPRVLANLVYVLHRCGKKEEALLKFHQLRQLSEDIDLTAAPFERLGEIAAMHGLPRDWREPWVAPRDFGPRPEKEKLGPLLFDGFNAPQFEFTDTEGRTSKVIETGGKPKLIVFYLGSGCLHCKEQISKSLAEKVEDFVDSGVEVMAVSPEKSDDLQKAVENFLAGVDGPGKHLRQVRFVADPEKAMFKAFHAYDYFSAEGAAELHATVLVDSTGKILWQDIGSEPYTDFNFLVEETRRLLELGRAR